MLTEYKRKRHFDKTDEPQGELKRAGTTKKRPRFVVQKHQASQLHYDFRLEHDSVLKSWAVPKGPSLDPHVKRLAIQVEDHPLEYASFEGVIPDGEYGGGEVIVWDAGEYEMLPDDRPSSGRRREPMAAGLKAGKLRFVLYGSKLTGEWLLIRSRQSGASEQWLLIKANSEPENTTPVPEVLLQDKSVVSGRRIQEL